MVTIPVEIDLELLQPGDQAPDFSLTDHRGEAVDSRDMRGSWILVWWYPQALGPGCLNCASALREATYELYDLGAKIVGITFSTPEENRLFAEKGILGFPLCTASEELADAYGANRGEHEPWRGLPRRLIYLVDPEGVVRQRYLITGDAKTEVPKVVADLRELKGEPEVSSPAEVHPLPEAWYENQVEPKNSSVFSRLRRLVRR